MVAANSVINHQEKEALLLMFGTLWQKRYWPLDGKAGRPSISECIDFALRKNNTNAQEDLVDFLELYLTNMAGRCEVHALKE